MTGDTGSNTGIPVVIVTVGCASNLLFEIERREKSRNETGQGPKALRASEPEVTCRLTEHGKDCNVASSFGGFCAVGSG